MLHLFIYAISTLCAIHGIQARSIKNDTLKNRIVALEKLVEKLEDRKKNGTNSSKEGLFTCLMVLNPTFSNISAISLRSFYWWRKPEDPEKTTDLSQVTDKLYHIMLCTSPWSRFELTTSVVIDSDCICSCKSNCHTITATKAPAQKTVHVLC